MFEDLTSMIVDIGTHHTRIGYGGDDAPKLMPYSYVTSNHNNMENQDSPKFKVGDKYLFSDRNQNEIDSIFHQKGADGYSFDYDKLEPFLEYNLRQQLGINLPDYSILLSEDIAAKPEQNKFIRQKLAQFFFERLNVANIFFLKAPVLSCFATGRSTALVIDSGQNFTRTVAVHQGFCLYRSIRVTPYGGKNISYELHNSIARKLGGSLQSKYAMSGKNHTSSFLQFHQSQLLSDIKEALSVRKQQEVGQAPVNSIEYQLPDKQIINIDRKDIKEGFLVGDEVGNAFRSTPPLVTQTINSCDVDVKKQLYSNILMAGGNVLFGSYIEDITAKIGESAPANVKVKPVSVCASSERKYLSWIGGSIVSSLSSFQSYWVGNQEWKQTGSSILDKKCV